jgi:hypothetical protein
MAISPQASGGVTLSYTEDKPGHKRVVERIDTFDGLLQRLYDIQASKVSDLFIGVNLEDAAHNALAVGLADEGWAVLSAGPQFTELLYSLSEAADAEGDIALRFEQWEVLPRKYFLPVDKAIEVIRTWFATGELSRAIRWERLSLLPDGG